MPSIPHMIRVLCLGGLLLLNTGPARAEVRQSLDGKPALFYKRVNFWYTCLEEEAPLTLRLHNGINPWISLEIGSR